MKRFVIPILALFALVLAGCNQLSTSFVSSQRQWFEKSAKPRMLQAAQCHPEDAAQIADSLAGENLVISSAEKSVGLPGPTTQP